MSGIGGERFSADVKYKEYLGLGLERACADRRDLVDCYRINPKTAVGALLRCQLSYTEAVTWKAIVT